MKPNDDSFRLMPPPSQPGRRNSSSNNNEKSKPKFSPSYREHRPRGMAPPPHRGTQPRRSPPPAQHATRGYRTTIRWCPPPQQRTQKQAARQMGGAERKRIGIHNNNNTQTKRPRVAPAATIQVKQNPDEIISPRLPSTAETETVSPDEISIHEESEAVICKEESEEDLCKEEIHIIFLIDLSKSMKKMDIQTQAGKRMTRWDAVFQSVKELVQQQLQENSILGGHSAAAVSLVIFNDKAQTLLKRIPLGDGQEVRNALETAHNTHTPRGGTGFSVAFQRARELATGHEGNVMVVFLSDGRPGDLPSQPPADSSMAMRRTTGKQKNPTAGVHIEAMKAEFKDRFNLQLICLCAEGKPWLKYLGEHYEGTFHMCDLALDGPTIPSAAMAQPEQSDSDDDEVVELKVKSQDTLIRERFQRAQASGSVFSIAATVHNTSIRATFQSISTTVTAMRSGPARLLQERQIVLEQNGRRSRMVEFPATRMVLKTSGDGIRNAPGEKSDGRVVSISKQPFAQGGLRNVFRMKEDGPLGGQAKVGKESRHEVPYAERLQFHLETSRCQARAADFAQTFNSRVAQRPNLRVPPIKVLRAEVYRLKDPDYPGRYRYLGVEEEIKGNYEKWNSNQGFVLDSKTQENHVAQAFSHFSFEYSNQEEMVVDIQGCKYTYTDPQLHSKGKVYGRADRGDSGFKDFFRTHECNGICKELGLTNRRCLRQS